MKARSDENNRAFQLLYQEKCYGVCIGLLRQELDSLIRLSYLWHGDTTKKEALMLVKLSLKGLEWKVNVGGKTKKITDKNMADLANKINGWELSIYTYGCKLIHLSNLHSYKVVDPFQLISKVESTEITEYLSKFHYFEGNNCTFNTVIEYLPKVMGKLIDNVNFYIDELNDGWLDKK